MRAQAITLDSSRNLEKSDRKRKKKVWVEKWNLASRAVDFALYVLSDVLFDKRKELMARFLHSSIYQLYMHFVIQTLFVFVTGLV